MVPLKRKTPPTTTESSSSTTTTPHSKRSKATSTDTDGNPYWALSTARRVTVSEFKGKKMVSIREYYSKDGEWLPGKKGITMTLEQYGELLKVVPEIEAVIGEEGRAVVGRVRYGDGDAEQDEDEVKVKRESEGPERRSRKANIEATSDEDDVDD